MKKTEKDPKDPPGAPQNLKKNFFWKKEKDPFIDPQNLNFFGGNKTEKDPQDHPRAPQNFFKNLKKVEIVP